MEVKNILISNEVKFCDLPFERDLVIFRLNLQLRANFNYTNLSLMSPSFTSEFLQVVKLI